MTVSESLRPVVALLIAIALLMLGNGLIGTLVALNMARQGHSAEIVGLVVAAYFAGQVAGSLTAHLAIERVGHIRTFAALASVISAACVAFPLLVSPWSWALLRFVIGACVAGLYMINESWLNAAAPNDKRGQVLSIYMVTTFSAMALGQLLLNLADPAEFILFSLCCILFSLSLVPVSLARSANPEPVEPTRFGVRALYRLTPLGLIACFACGIISSGVFGLGPVVGADLGFDTSQVATFMTALIVGGIVMQWPLGKLSDLIDRRVVIAGVFAALVGSCVALTLIPASEYWLFIAVSVVFGGLVFVLYPLCIAHANDYVEAKDMVAAAGGLLFVYSVGAALGPVAISFLTPFLGPAALFPFIGAVSAALFLFTLIRMRVRAGVPNEEQGPYINAPRTSAVAYELDPRWDEDADAETSLR